MTLQSRHWSSACKNSSQCLSGSVRVADNRWRFLQLRN